MDDTREPLGLHLTPWVAGAQQGLLAGISIF
jgi:hypothetical protein